MNWTPSFLRSTSRRLATPSTQLHHHEGRSCKDSLPRQGVEIGEDLLPRQGVDIFEDSLPHQGVEVFEDSLPHQGVGICEDSLPHQEVEIGAGSPTASCPSSP